MKKITILFSVGSLSTGGKEKQLAETIKGISAEKYSAFLIHSGGKAHFFERIAIYLKGSKDINRYDVYSFIKYCISVKPEVICCWSRPTAYYSLFYKALIDRNCKILNCSIQSAPVKKSIFTLLDSVPYYLYSFVVGNSVAGLKTFGQFGRRGRFVLYNGIDVPDFTQDERVLLRKKLSYPEAIFMIPMVAGLKNTKDHTALIKAAKLVQDGDASIRFYVVGEGPNRVRIEQLVAEEGITNVSMLGNRTDALEILAASNLSVLCSTNGEGLSNSIMESLALGVPVVATAGGGTGEMLEDGKNGYLIPIGDYRALADKILFLKNNPGVLAQMSIEASKVRDKFSVAKMIENFDSIIDQVYSANKPLSKDK